MTTRCAWLSRRQRARALVLIVLVGAAPCSSAGGQAYAELSLAAQPAAVGASYTHRDARADSAARSAAPAPLSVVHLRRADWWKLGSLAGLAVVAGSVDRRGDAWARRADVQGNSSLRTLSNVGDATGVYAATTVGPVTWLLGRTRGDSGTAVLGLRTTEAVFLSAASIGAIKVLAGRTRPYASADNSPTHWDLFGGRRSDSTRSFASGHTALSTAAAITLAAEWRRQGMRGWKTVGPPLVYSLAALTAGSRVRDRQHWLSDVVSGAAVGMASALIVRRWHDAHPRSWIDRFFLAH